MLRKGAAVLAMLLALTLPACTAVDETEWCVETRYGKTVAERMSTGLNGTLVTAASCFPTTEQNHVLTDVPISTNDPIQLTYPKIIVVWEYPDNLYEKVFLDKREHRIAVAEINAAIEEGLNAAGKQFSLSDVFSPRFSEVPEAMRVAAQAAVGERAVVRRVILSGKVTGIEHIEGERAKTLLAQQEQQTARQNFLRDSITNTITLAREQTLAKVKELTANAYAENPKLLELEVARAEADGLAKAMGNCTNNCVIGGAVETRRR